jgi:peroxiredoxin Q/BCP
LINTHYKFKSISHDQKILLPVFFSFQLFAPNNPVWPCPIEDAIKRRCSASIYCSSQPGGSEFNFSLKKSLAKGPVVVYFYPSAYTGGCDAEAHAFAELKDKFTTAGATIIGVSGDDIKRLNTFSSDPNYCAGKFAVASDAGGKIAKTYGLVMTPPKLGMKDVRGIEVNHGFIPRTTYVIGKDGKIAAVFSSETDHISATDHVEKSLAIVKGM